MVKKTSAKAGNKEQGSASHFDKGVNSLICAFLLSTGISILLVYSFEKLAGFGFFIGLIGFTYWFYAKTDTMKRTWGRTFIGLSIESFLLPIVMFVFTASQIIATPPKSLAVIGLMIGGGISIVLSAIIGFFLGVVFLIAGILILISASKDRPTRQDVARFPFFVYTEKNVIIFISSLKSIRWKILLIALLDLLFYFASFAVIMAAYKILKAKYDAIPFPGSLGGITAEQTAILLEQSSKAFYYSLIGGMLLAALCIIVLWSLFKGVIWALTARQRITPPFLWRFFFLFAGWLGPWFLFFALLAYIANPQQAQMLFFALIALFIILGNSILALFVLEPGWASIRRGFHITFTKLHILALPYLAFLFAYFVMTKLLSMVPGVAGQATALAFTLLFFAVARAYALKLVAALDEKGH